MNKNTAVLCLMLAPTVSFADNHAPAKEAMCRTCHGVGGAQPIAPSYPKLNGQNKDYLVGALKAYKAGQRTGGLAAAMAGQAAALSDADIEALAEFYASQK